MCAKSPDTGLELTPFGGHQDSGLGYKEGVLEAMKASPTPRPIRCPVAEQCRRCLHLLAAIALRWLGHATLCEACTARVAQSCVKSCGATSATECTVSLQASQ